MLGWRGDT